MIWFSKCPCPSPPTSVYSAGTSSLTKRSPMSGDSLDRQRRFAETVPIEYSLSFGQRAAALSAFLATSRKPNGTTPYGENYLAKLVRLGRRPTSLLMRVDISDPHDVTYVIGRQLTKFRVRTLSLFDLVR